MAESSENRKHIINLESERLLLRNIQPGDRDFVIGLWTDPETTRYMGGPREIETLEADVNGNINNPFADEYDLWIVTDKKTGKPAGHCGLLEKDVEGKREIEVVYVIGKDYRRKGYAVEITETLIEYAFRVKNQRSIIALIKPDNNISAKVALKAGLKLEKEIIRQENTRMLLYRRSRV